MYVLLHFFAINSPLNNKAKYVERGEKFSRPGWGTRKNYKVFVATHSSVIILSQYMCMAYLK